MALVISRCGWSNVCRSLRAVFAAQAQMVHSRSACALAEASVEDTAEAANTLPRAYKTAGVQEDQGQYHITLDGRTMRTPALQPLRVPTRSLALAIAAEWEQQDRRVRPFTMPLMTLAATAIDEPKPREGIIDTLLEYLHTDSTCCRDQPGPTADMQALAFDPIVQWAERHFAIDLVKSDSIFGAQQSERTQDRLRDHLEGLDQWHLAAVDSAAGACRSVILGLALIEGQLGVKDAVTAARLEETLQISEWGLVEGGHDIDIADAHVRVTAPSLFVRLLHHP